MVSFREVCHRALHGSLVSPREFDLGIFLPTMRETVRKFDIQYDPDNPVPMDDDLADRVFRAGIEFYEKVGTYCLDSERVIRFTEEEIDQALESAPSSVYLGHGSDRRQLVARQPESQIAPWCSLGAAGAGVSGERIFTSLMTAYASNPLTDSITTPSLTTIDGHAVVADTPLEIEGAIRATRLSRECLRRAGRPGIPLVNGIATAVSGRATIAASHFGFRETDGWEIASIAELKTNFDLLSKITYIRSVGGNILAETGPIFGGMAGGPEGTAVLNVAYHIEGILVKQACLHHPFPIHAKFGCGTGRELLWVQNISTLAITRNSHFPLLNLGYTAAGPMTRMVLYETAAWVIPSVVCGANIEAVGVASATHVDHLTPYEPQFAAEVAHASVNLDRSQANTTVKALLDKYEHRIPEPPLGRKYQECFDVESATALDEYTGLYDEVREELSDMGLKL